MVDIRPMVEKYSVLPTDRLRLVNQFADLRLSEMRRAIVFVYAVWSGPAVLALKRFTQVMSEMPTDALDLVILHNDCLNDDSMTQLFETAGFPAGGNGETFWIKDGVIIASEFAAPNGKEEALRKHTRKLLT